MRRIGGAIPQNVNNAVGAAARSAQKMRRPRAVQRGAGVRRAGRWRYCVASADSTHS